MEHDKNVDPMQLCHQLTMGRIIDGHMLCIGKWIDYFEAVL